MDKVGIVFGCFIPLHKGHLSLIDKALKNDKVVIGVCGYDLDRGKDFIPFKDRIELIKEIFNDLTVVSIDDHKIGLTGKFDLESWKLWCNELFKNADLNPLENEITWYLGEQSYLEMLKKIYPKHTFELVERTVIPVSGTMIRENPKENIKEIHPVFIKYLKEKNII